MWAVRAAVAAALVAPGSALAVDLAIDGACPGPVTIDVSALTPGGEWAIMTGTGPGSDAIGGGVCGGTVTGLASMSVRMPTRIDDGSGASVISATFPSAACGRYLQIVDMTTCDVSPVDQIPSNVCAVGGTLDPVVEFPDTSGFPAPTTAVWDGYGTFVGDAGAADNVARYDALGTLDITWSTGVPSTGLFNLGDGVPGLLSREPGTNQIFQVDPLAPATPLFTLDAIPVPADANIAYDAVRGQLIAHEEASIRKWNVDGSPAGSLTLPAWGMQIGEAGGPGAQHIATASGCYLTYNNAGLSSWDATGTRAGVVTLNGAGVSDVAHTTVSYAKGLVWVLDDIGGMWRGYDVGLAPAPGWSFGSPVDADLTDYPEETRFVTSGGTSTWVSWTADDLFVGINHPDVQFGGSQHWVVIYLGDGSGMGGLTGPVLNTQEPLLPFPASHVIRWKADDSYDDMQMWDGANWVGTSFWLNTEGSAKAENNDWQNAEFRIPRALLGGSDVVEMVVAMVYEGGGFESTYAAIPGGTLGGADGVYDPDFAEFYRFDLRGPNPPNATFPSLPPGP